MSDVTSATLLGRLQDNADHEAWNSFYQFYTPMVLGFCLQKGASQQLASDVLQETMVCLMRTLNSFTYKREAGKFRSFLLNLVQARLCDALRRQHRSAELFSGQDPIIALDRFYSVEGPADVNEWEHQWRLGLLRQALERIRLKINEQTYRSFKMYVLEEMSAAETASALGISENLVYQHRNRVQSLLKKEIEFLKRNWEGEF
jgi:RNA polymerase sigma factor (sigma-70 family)